MFIGCECACIVSVGVVMCDLNKILIDSLRTLEKRQARTILPVLGTAYTIRREFLVPTYGEFHKVLERIPRDFVEHPTKSAVAFTVASCSKLFSGWVHRS